MPINKILLNGNDFECSEADLPMLIHGEDKAGASLFTVSYIANLFARGSKLLCITGYHMARDEFYKQTNAPHSQNAVFCLKEEVEDFESYIKTLPDIEERVIVIKNIELFSEEVFNLVYSKQLLIISGDINKCVFKEKILNLKFKTKVLFSKLDKEEMPDLQKYQGFLANNQTSGIATVQMN